MQKILLTATLIFVSTFTFAQQPFWVEYQNNWKHYKKDSMGTTSHTLEAFYTGKANKAGYSINLFALATKGWGELSIQPTWTKETKIGLLSFSLGVGIETGTVRPRFMGSAFFLKHNTEFLFYWEQGADFISNNWHLCYLMQKIIQHEEGAYCSVGLHSQRGTVHGLRFEIGSLDEFAVYVVLGKPTFKQQSLAAMIGARYFIQR